MHESSDGAPQPSHYHVERLDSVREELKELKGKIEFFATREDIANAKVSMLTMYLVLGATIAAAVVGAIVRFWPDS